MKERRSIYIALENWNLFWSIEEIKEFFELWIAGFSLDYISKHLERNSDELALLIIEISSKQKHFFPQRDRGIHISSPVEWTGFHNRYFSLFLKNLEEDDGYTLCFEQDMFWDRKEVLYLEKLWDNGKSLTFMEEKFQRDNYEIILLLLDRITQGKINPRHGGIEGMWLVNAIKESSGETEKHKSA